MSNHVPMFNGLTRKYTDVTISNSINVSSSFSYTAKVILTRKGGYKDRWDFWVDGEQFLGKNLGTWNAPDYVRREVERQLAKLLISPTVRFFEYDRDGNERTENLRYHDPEFAASMAKRFADRTQAGKAEVQP